MPEIRRKYDVEFRAGAVTIVRETGKPIRRGGSGPRHRRRHVGELGEEGPSRPWRGVRAHQGRSRSMCVASSVRSPS